MFPDELLGAMQGNQTAIKERDLNLRVMSPEQIAEAQKKPQLRQVATTPGPARTSSSQVGVVPLKADSGIFVVPVELNGSMTLDFAIDSGAADVSVPADVFSTLKRTGTVKEADFIGQRTHVLADGSRSQSPTFTIRLLKVGDVVLENVTASVAPSQGSLLLAQSFLSRFKSWSIDNTTHELLLVPR